MVPDLRDIIGFRGEKLVELCLTKYGDFPGPLFRPGFLGDKWPSIDFYVELNGLDGRRPYFLAQVKSTARALSDASPSLPISTKQKDIAALLQIPGPTYILGVHEPSGRVFARSVHAGISVPSVSSIPVTHELTSTNLAVLHQEVRDFWSTSAYKPESSVFS